MKNIISKLMNKLKESQLFKPKQCECTLPIEKSIVLIGSKGEVGSAILSMIKKADKYKIYEIDKGMALWHPPGIESVDYMHYCVPFADSVSFLNEVKRYAKLWNPKHIILHSTVLPGTTKDIYKSLNIPISYTPCRGQHNSLLKDFQRYTKRVATPIECGEFRDDVEQHLISLGFKVSGNSIPEILEVSKLLDTTHYGINIMYAQIANRICNQYGFNYEQYNDFMMDSMPYYPELKMKLYPGYCGGHCVRQNIDLLKKVHKHTLWKVFDESNKLREKELGKGN